MIGEKNEKLGCLIIHGFAGSIEQIESLDKYLNNKDYITSCPKLKGHTGNPNDMKNADYKEWINSAEEALLKLRKKTDKIVIVGFSMGGLIAINLANKYDIKAIITINTPIYYWNLKMVFKNILHDIRNRRLYYIKRYIQAKKAAPLISLINFLKLLNETKAKLSNIKCPFLIIQTKDDDTTRVKSADYIYENINSKDKIMKFYDKGGHLVLVSHYKEEIFKDVEEFIGKLNI